MSRTRLAIVAAAALGASVVALVVLVADSDGRSLAINEGRGTVAGVGVGDSEAAVRRVFGRPETVQGGPYAPLGESHVEIGGPLSIPIPAQGGAEAPLTLRYQDVAFLVVDGHVLSFMVTGDGSKTTRGVGVGDRLDAVREAFPQVKCGESPPFGEPVLPFDEPESYPYCRGRLRSQRFIWFGEDPVRNVTITDYSGFVSH